MNPNFPLIGTSRRSDLVRELLTQIPPTSRPFKTSRSNCLPPGMFADTVIDQMRTPLIVLDQELCVVYANQAAEQLVSNTRQHIYGHSIFDWVQVEETSLRSQLSEALSGVPLFHRRATLWIAPNKQVLSDYSITSYEQSAGKYLLLEILPFDRFARIERSDERRSRTDQMHELARGVAHEIKNPLGGILGSAQLLERELQSDEQRDYTGIIIDEVQRLRRMVDQMLMPGSLPSFEPTNVHEVVEHGLRIVGLSDYEGIDFQREYDPSLPLIAADGEMLIQAVLNVLRNAVEAVARAPAPRIRVRSCITPTLTINGQMHRQVISIHIQDNGCGVPAELHDSLFLPLTKGKNGGTGLGLSIAHHAISIHGGMIEFRSAHGDTCFTIHLPVTKAENGT